MAEPTLGSRILEAADRHAEAYGWWLADDSENDAPGPLYAGQQATREHLRALCDRADAAERLAVATCERRTKRGASLTVAIREEEAARRAWRALGEVGG